MMTSTALLVLSLYTHLKGSEVISETDLMFIYTHSDNNNDIVDDDDDECDDECDDDDDDDDDDDYDNEEENNCGRKVFNNHFFPIGLVVV